MGCPSSKTPAIETNAIPAPEEVKECALKYSGRLLPIEVGHIVTIVAKSKENAEFFNIFFGSDSGLVEDFDDIQFHLAVNFEKKIIERNFYTKNSGWGEAEVEKNLAPGNSTNPIKRGELFKMEIFVDAEMFHVSIDNKPFCTFKHRQNIAEIHRINLLGEIEKIYQITHKTSKELVKAAVDKSLVNEIPSAKSGSVLALNAMPQGSEEGSFEINLSDKITRRVLFQFKANFEEKKIYGNSQNDGMEWVEIKLRQIINFF